MLAFGSNVNIACSFLVESTSTSKIRSSAAVSVTNKNAERPKKKRRLERARPTIKESVVAGAAATAAAAAAPLPQAQSDSKIAKLMQELSCRSVFASSSSLGFELNQPYRTASAWTYLSIRSRSSVRIRSVGIALQFRCERDRLDRAGLRVSIGAEDCLCCQLCPCCRFHVLQEPVPSHSIRCATQALVAGEAEVEYEHRIQADIERKFHQVH